MKYLKKWENKESELNNITLSEFELIMSDITDYNSDFKIRRDTFKNGTTEYECVITLPKLKSVYLNTYHYNFLGKKEAGIQEGLHELDIIQEHIEEKRKIIENTIKPIFQKIEDIKIRLESYDNFKLFRVTTNFWKKDQFSEDKSSDHGSITIEVLTSSN